MLSCTAFGQGRIKIAASSWTQAQRDNGDLCGFQDRKHNQPLICLSGSYKETEVNIISRAVGHFKRLNIVFF